MAYLEAEAEKIPLDVACYLERLWRVSPAIHRAENDSPAGAPAVLALPPDQPPHEALGSTNATRGVGALVREFANSKQISAPLASWALPWHLLCRRGLAGSFDALCSSHTLGDAGPTAIGPDWAVGLPDCWAFATMTPPTSAAVASRFASIFIETSRDVPRNYRGLSSRPAILGCIRAAGRLGTPHGKGRPPRHSRQWG